MTESTNGPAPEGTEPHATTENESRHDTTPPNLEALTWFRILHGERDGYIEIRAFPPGQSWPHCYWFATPEEAARLVPQLDAEGCEIFAGVARRRVYGGGKKEHLAHTVALWIDWDKPELPNLHGFSPPSFIVKSGNGYHLYWLLEQPVALDTDEGIGWLEATERGLADAVGETHAAIDAGRILRVPGTRNLKNRAAPIHCTLFENDGHVYEPEAFEAFTTRGAKPNGTTRTPYESEAWDGELPERVAVVLDESPGLRALWNGDTSSLTGEDKSDSVIDLAVANRLVGRGITDGAELEAALRYRRQQVGAKPKHDGYFTATVGKALENAAPKPGISSQTPTSEEQIHEPEAPPDALEDFTEDGLVRRLIRFHGDDVRHVPLWSRWLVWDGARWKIDEENRARDVVRRTINTVVEEVRERLDREEPEKAERILRAANKLRRASEMRSVLWIAAGDPSLVIHHEALDPEPWLLNVENGTLDLRTGELRPHRRSDRITKRVPVEYDPEARAPLFESFLQRVQPDPEVRGFLQRVVGYSLTGETQEEVVVVNVGGGSNGKTTLMETLRACFGDYGIALPAETVLKAKSSAIPNDLAQLPGRRFATVVETPEGRKLDEERIKALSSGDRMAARFMRAEWFEFTPQAKFWLSTNHRPSVGGDDDGIWRRIRLVPWTVQIPPEERDMALREKLLGELPGILAWAVKGCLDWQGRGLEPPKAILDATAAYRSDEDEFSGFLAECCRTGSALSVSSKRFRTELDTWAKENGYATPSAKMIAERLKRRGFRPCNVGRARGWQGIDVVTAQAGHGA